MLIIPPPHFHLKILLFFIHVDEAKTANKQANKRMIYLPPFWNKVYRQNEKALIQEMQPNLRKSKWEH